MGFLDGKVAVITGAGSGMAKASVKIFIREGAKVVAGDISGAEKDTAAEVGGDILPVHCDVTKEADIEALVRLAEHQGKLILQISDGNKRSYVVEDGSTAYRYSVHSPEPVTAMVWPPPAARDLRARR